VSQSLRFLSTAIRSGFYKELFGQRDTISALIQGVVVPNVSLRGKVPILRVILLLSKNFTLAEHELEQFEDDPLEFIRLDLSLPGSSEVTTRRQAAADILQALVSSGYEGETTEIVGSWIASGLQEYRASPAQNWRSKDNAVYLLTAIASRGSTIKVSLSFFFLSFDLTLL
jgi:exportin-2 (importin alpha re-exporter)